jgi:hypothetical protein
VTIIARARDTEVAHSASEVTLLGFLGTAVSVEFVYELRKFLSREGVLVRDFGEVFEAMFYARENKPDCGRHPIEGREREVFGESQ